MNTNPDPKGRFNDRVIRVFVSSTFRDMMRERDLLVKEGSSPRIFRHSVASFSVFQKVDLRTQKTLKKILHWRGCLVDCASAFPGMGAEFSENLTDNCSLYEWTTHTHSA